MNKDDKYFELIFTKRINEYKRIDNYKNWDEGTAKNKYKTLDGFYLEELGIDSAQLEQLRADYKNFNDLYSKYFNADRAQLFNDPEKFIEWYDAQSDRCDYCKISQSELKTIVEGRGGNLTLNQKTKRSKGTLEIEKKNANIDIGYTFANCVLCCPLCNNAKSNLISEENWREFFAPAMKKFYNSILMK